MEWIRKKDVEKLKLWEGDKIFFRLLDLNYPCFSLKLRYEGDDLAEAVLDGVDILQAWRSDEAAWRP